MRRLVGRSLLVALLVLGLAVLAGGVALWSFDVDAYRGELSAAFSERLGLDAKLVGKVSLELGLHPRIEATRVSIRSYETEWSEPIARIEHLELRFDLWRAFWYRDVSLGQVYLRDVELRFERNELGASNLDRRRRVGEETAPLESGGSLTFLVRSAEIENLRVHYEDALAQRSVDGGLERLRLTESDDERSLALDATGRLYEGEFRARGRIEVPAGVPKIAPGLMGEHLLTLKIDLPAAELHLTGRITNPIQPTDLALEVSARVESIEEAVQALRIETDADLAGLGPLELEARLAGGRADIRLEDISVQLQSGAGDRLGLEGRLGDLLRRREMDLTVELDSPKLDGLIRRVQLDAPSLGRAHATARLAGEEERLVLDRIEATLTHVAGVELSLSGSLKREAGDLTHAVAAVLTAEELGDVLDWIAALRAGDEGEPPAEASHEPWQRAPAVRGLGPVRVEGRLLLDGGRLGLSGIEAELGEEGDDWLRAQGKVDELIPNLTGVDLEVSIGSEDLQRLAQQLDVFAPQLDRVRGQGVLYSHAGGLGVREMELVAVHQDRARIGISGSLPDLSRPGGSSLRVGLAADDLASLGEVIERDLPPAGPVKVTAVVVTSEEGFSAKGIEIELGESELAGDVSLDWKQGTRPYLAASVRSSTANLSDFGIDPAAISERRSGESSSKKGSQKLPYEDLELLDADVSLSIGGLRGRAGFEVEDVEVSAHLKDGVLQSDDLDMKWKGGAITAAVEIDGKSDVPGAELRLRAVGINVARVLAQLHGEGVAAGDLEINVELRSRARTRKALLSALEGEVFFYVHDGKLHRRFSEALQLDVTGTTAEGEPKSEFEVVNCLVVYSTISRGVAKLQMLLMDTDEQQVLGSGHIDVFDQTLNVVLTPSLKEPIPGSVAAAVRVTGDLSDPDAMVAPLATAGATTQALIDRAMIPVRKLAPILGRALDEAAADADEAASSAGLGVPDTLWRAGIDVTCDSVLEAERIEQLRAWRQGERID